MRLIDADEQIMDLVRIERMINTTNPLVIKLFGDMQNWVEKQPTVDAVKPAEIINALMDLRDAFVAKQPRGEWYKSDRAQGIEQGIEMAIEKVREMAERREDG